MLTEEQRGYLKYIMENSQLGQSLNECQAIRLFGSITPMFNVSEQCAAASNNYLLYLTVFPESYWPIQFLDSSGKLPDGILAESKPFCEVLAQYKMYVGDLVPNCDEVDQLVGINGLGSILKLINIPNGNTKAWGTLEGCIEAKSYLPSDATIGNFSGRWGVVNLVDKSTLQNNDDPVGPVRLQTPNPNERMNSGISVIPSLPGLEWIIDAIKENPVSTPGCKISILKF